MCKLTRLLAVCVVLASCVPILPPFKRPGPLVANQFATGVDWEVRLTDGTVRRGSHAPCRGYKLLEAQRADRHRTVFVKRLTFWRDGAAIGEYEGAKVEALGAPGGTAVLDESGLRRQRNGQMCSRVFNALDQNLRVRARYPDGSTASVTLRPCAPLLWTGADPIRGKEGQEDTIPTRLTITHDGAVIHDLDEHAFRKTFKQHLARRAMVYAVGASAIAGKLGVDPPRQCLRRDAEGDSVQPHGLSR